MPGQLVVLCIFLVLGAVCFGAIGFGAEHSRARAVQAARTGTEPLLVQAVNLYTALSDANATAARTFLQGSLEQPATRARYAQDLRLAADALATLTQKTGGSADTSAAVRTIARQVPVYAGLVEAARANNRQGFPVGAAYLRRASTLLTGTILPEANRLYTTEVKHLSDDYAAGARSFPLIVLAVTGGVALALLVVAQGYLARITRRVFNVPIVIGTVVLAAVTLWALVGLIREQGALSRARRASDSVEVLSASQVLLSRSEGDQSLTLINRGSDEVDPADFGMVMHAVSPTGGLLADASRLAASGADSAAIRRLDADYAAFASETSQIDALESRGQLLRAIPRAASAASNAIADDLNAAVSAQVRAAQTRFKTAASDTGSSLSGLSIAIPLLTAVAAGLAIYGIRQRLRDFR